ncbi:MAG: PQQ-binding-like beta-propeller repeat protein [Rubripirellula sp.]
MLCFRWVSGAVVVTGLCILASATALADGSWPQFRGASGDGIVAGQSVPVEFGEGQHVTWKTPLPGRAWSSPVIADGVIWVTSAVERTATDEERVAMMRESGIEDKKMKQLAIAKAIELKLISVDLKTGDVLSTVELATIEKPDAIHSLNSYASPTPVIDGGFLYCHFGTYGTFCVNRKSGEIAWQRRFPLEHGVGPGSSPLVDGNVLVLIQDGMDRQYVIGLDKKTGETIWETPRPEFTDATPDTSKSYCTPIVINDGAGRHQLICMGAQWMVAYESETGKEIWRLYHGKGFSVVPRPVFHDDVVFFSTGFGKPQLWAVRVDGSGDVTDSHVEWTSKSGIPARPSPLLHDGLLYVVSDNGVASCFDIEDGEMQWKERIGGDYSASPTLVGGLIYFGSHDGKVTVMKPGREANIVAVNEVEGKIMASPAIVDDAMILRTDSAIYRIEE